MEILRVENAKKVYNKGSNNEVKALDDVSFTIKKGEFVAIVGESGSGKSTLLHLLAGLDSLSSGKIYIDGIDISKYNSDELAIFRRRQIGIVYQFYNLIPILNVEENIALPLKLDGKDVKEVLIDGLLDMLKLTERKYHLPSELSGGQQQRVSIARSLITRPALLLADEPTGNLDSKTTEEIISIFKSCNKNFKQTIIMITHNMEQAKIADRIIKFSDGKIVEVK